VSGKLGPARIESIFTDLPERTEKLFVAGIKDLGLALKSLGRYANMTAFSL
jgi:hypothetical protein